MPICPICGEPIHQSRSISWVHDDGRSICSQAGAAVAFGTAIRKRSDKSIIDVELSVDSNEAEHLAAQQNAKPGIMHSRIEWVVVEIRALEPQRTKSNHE